jgi:hypothetical protein
MSQTDSTSETNAFQAGILYSATEIQNTLHVGNAGGVRVALNQEGTVERLVLLTAAPSARVAKENPYHDRVEGDVLVYTAAGLSGDQSLTGVNRRILLQMEQRFPIYGFRLNESRRKTTPKRWEFLGLLQLLRHYPDTQLDKDGRLRRIWKFELRVASAPTNVIVKNEGEAAELAFKTVSLTEPAEQDVILDPLHGTTAPNDVAQIETVRRTLLGVDPRQFEQIIMNVLSASGFKDVAVTRYSQDGGVDVNAYVGGTCWPLSGLHVQIQAKRWLRTVGRREIAELRGSLGPHARGAVVTTSHFSRAAIVESSAAGKVPIVLIDGYQFSALAKQHAAV